MIFFFPKKGLIVLEFLQNKFYIFKNFKSFILNGQDSDRTILIDSVKKLYMHGSEKLNRTSDLGNFNQS